MKQLIIIVLILVGFYFLIDHRAPLPLNHEAIGLGTNHMAHSIFGILLFIAAGYLWFKGRSKKGQVSQGKST